MHPVMSFILAATIGACNARALVIAPRATTQFPAGMTWDVVLDGSKCSPTDLANAKGDVIDIDLFDNIANGVINNLSKTKKVICYFSAGSREAWRSDANNFAKNDYGKNMSGWPGENWVDVKSVNVRAIMQKRIELAARSGCTAVDPDNVDGYDGNQDGFNYPQSAYADYVKFLAQTAAANNLAIGLKNALELIPSVVNDVQFAVNEQCHQYNECSAYKPFTVANKAVFNIEYGKQTCTQPNGVKLSIIIKNKNQALDTLGGQCS